jgi:hypothetical protein
LEGTFNSSAVAWGFGVLRHALFDPRALGQPQVGLFLANLIFREFMPMLLQSPIAEMICWRNEAMIPKRATIFAMLILSLVSGCLGYGLQGSPEGAAQVALDSWAKSSNTPYKDASFNTQNNDGTFATVRITVKFRPNPESEWQEYQTDVQCRLVGGQWQAPGYLQFQLSQAEQRKQAAATATAQATRMAAVATSQAILANATATVEASRQYLLRTLGEFTTNVWSVAFSPDGKTLVSGCYDDTVKIWDIATGKELRTFTGMIAVFSPNGKTIVTMSKDKPIKLWDVTSGQVIRTLDESRPEASVAFSPDGKTLASVSLNNMIRLWDVASGKELRTINAEGVYSVIFSPDGKTLAAGSSYRTITTIRQWEVATGRELRTLSGHAEPVASVAFSPDGKTLASGSADKSIKLWDVSNGKVLRTLIGHTDIVFSVMFSPDGRILASGSRDQTVRLWDAATGLELRTLGYGADVTSVAFSPDGSILASGGWAGTLKLWRAK